MSTGLPVAGLASHDPVSNEASLGGWIAGFARWTEHPSNRYRLYASIAAGLFVFAWLSVAARSRERGTSVDFAVGDAQGYYVYLPSLATYGNFDFTQSILEQSDGHEIDPKMFTRVGGRLRNRWPLGIALTISPGFFLAHIFSLVLYRITGSQTFFPHGYSILYQAFSVTLAMAFGCLALVLADDLVTRHFRLRGVSTAMGVITYWVGSNFSYYYFREPLMAHMISAGWVIVAVWSIDRVANRLREGRVVPWEWLLLGVACGIAVVCRYTNVVLVAPLIYLAWSVVQCHAVGRVAKVIPLALIGAVPLACQYAITRLASNDAGHAAATHVQNVQPLDSNRLHFVVGYSGNEGFVWGRPALAQTLISPMHGIFFWSPILLLGVAGIGWHLVRRRGYQDGLFVAILGAGLALWYLNSAWYAWSFGDAFGARAFVDIAIFFIVGMALGCEWIGTLTLGARRVVTCLVLLCVGYNWALALLYMTHRISHFYAPWVVEDTRGKPIVTRQ